MNGAITYTTNGARRLEEIEWDDGRFLSNHPPPGGGPPTDNSGGGGGVSLSTAAGFALTGGVIFNGLDGGNDDAVENEADGLDKCLSHSSPQGQLHYHSLSNCVHEGSTSTKPGLCYADTNCIDNIGDFMTAPWSTDDGTYGGVYGIARDGHVIYGPYNEDGELWGCDDHDICNGFFLPDGSYGYAATTHFPYIVGCWGPGPAQTYSATCSSLGCTSFGYDPDASDDDNEEDNGEVDEEDENAEDVGESSATTLLSTAGLILALSILL